MNPEAQLSSVAAYKIEVLLFFTLLQLAVIVLAGRLGGEMAVRVGQSAAVGEIIVGVMLGPSVGWCSRTCSTTCFARRRRSRGDPIADRAHPADVADRP